MRSSIRRSSSMSTDLALSRSANYRAVLQSPSRRSFFAHVGHGILGGGLLALLADDAIASGGIGPSLSRRPHFAPRATAVIQLFMTGGPSHVDLLDPKPALAKHAGDLP